jgi:subfamily B ATP-binding cassette protein MsbA
MNSRKSFTRVLKFAVGSRRLVPRYIFFTLLTVIFGVLNISLLIPLLQIIFERTEVQQLVKPEFHVSIGWAVAWFKYIFNEIMIEYGKMGTLYFVCGLVLMMVLIANIGRYFSQRIMIKIRINISRNIRRTLFEKMANLDMSFYNNQKKGDLMSTFSNDVQTVEETIVGSMQGLFKDPLMIIFSFCLLFYLSVKLTLFTLIIFPISGLLITQISKRLKRESKVSQSILGNLLSLVEESISGIRIIKAFNAQKYISGKMSELNDDYNSRLKVILYRRELASPLTEFVGYIIAMGIILFVGPMILGGEGSMSGGDLIAYLAAYIQILVPAKNIATAISNIQRGVSSSERIFNILDEPNSIVESPNAMTIDEFKEQIEIRDLSFAYERGDEGHVLKDINLIVPKGKMIALVGHSGSGKSTLSDMLPRYYDPSSGGIYIDGINIKDYKITDLRQLMGVVSQESILFNDTIFNNIAFGNPLATEDQVMEAAKIANAHDFIMETDLGYQTNIGDRGSRLSGGQRQRLSIARAVLKNPPIMILDEATSALDAESEKVVQEALANLMKNRTSIVIAHRLSTVQNADMIVVLDKGIIAQQGTHEELIVQEGIYKQLKELQKLS